MKEPDAPPNPSLDRRAFLARAFGVAGASAAGCLALGATETHARAEASKKEAQPQIAPRDKLKITKVETRLVKPRWLFLQIHTDAGITGLGEPILEGRAKTCATAVEELAPYLIGKDPRAVVHHWQAMYRHAFYRGGPILTSALSGVEQALWDLAGKAVGLPVYRLLGGPTRDRLRMYRGVGGRTPEEAAANARACVAE